MFELKLCEQHIQDLGTIPTFKQKKKVGFAKLKWHHNILIVHTLNRTTDTPLRIL